ncbi:beta strand repeat-containing protein [Novosphingobium sp.]|uniref:beta strand repeat-containing protein n=1 Tax=Novosphingobium sp. TaxID=1874826 RepID=UPI003D153060
MTVYNGTSGNDTFVIGPNDVEQAGSVFDGGGGTNTLVIDNATDLSQDTVANFQTIVNNSSGTVTLDISQLAGVTELDGKYTIVGNGIANFASLQVLKTGPTYFGAGVTSVDFSHTQLLDQPQNSPFFELDNAGMSFFGGNFAYFVHVAASGVTVTSGSGGGFADLGYGGGTFIGGSGTDSVNVDAGLVNITGGSGNLSVYLIAAPSSGSTFTGGTGTSSLYLDAGMDLSGLAISGFTSLNAQYATTVSASEVAAFTSITGPLVINSSAAISMAGKSLFNLTVTLAPGGGSIDFTGASVNEVIVTGSGYRKSPGVTVNGGNGANTITGSSGDDVINITGQGDVIEGAGGDDTVTINNTAGEMITGSYDGGTGVNTLVFNGGDLSHAAVTNFQALAIDKSGVSSVTLTTEELAYLTTSLAVANVQLADGGTVSLSGSKGQNTQFHLSDSATTLDLSGFLQANVIVTGGAGNDTIVGLASGTPSPTTGYVDQLYGGGGNDVLIGSSGNDYLDGGTGINTAVYTGVKNAYHITEAADYSFVLADLRAGSPDGTDHLASIQDLQFADGVVDLTAATLAWTGDGNTFELYAGQTLSLYNASVTGDAVNGNNGTIDLIGASLAATGNNQTVDADTGSLKVSSNGSSNTIKLEGATLATVGGNSQNAAAVDTVIFAQSGTTTNGGSVIETDNSYVKVTGASLIATLGNADTMVIDGGNETILMPDSGDIVTMTGTAGNWDSVTGSGENLTLNGAQAAITGGGNSIGFAGSGDIIGLYGTDGSWDSISGSAGTIYLTGAQAAITGGGDTISFAGGTGNVVGLYDTGGSWDSVWAPGGDTLYLTSAQAAIAGGGDTISFAGGTGNVVGLYDTGGSWDSVWAPGGDTIYLTSAQAAIAGGGDTISFAGGTGNVVGLYDTGGTWDNIWAPGGETIYLTSAQAAIAGGGDAISFAGGTGNVVGLYNTGGTSDTVWAPGGGTIDLTSATAIVTGGGDTIGFAGGTGNAATLQNTNGVWDTEWGSTGTLNLVDAQVGINGSSITVNFAGSDTVTLFGTTETLAFKQGIGGKDVINGFAASDTLQVSASDFDNWAHLMSSGDITQVGADTLITLDANDSIRLTNFTASKLTSAQVHFT